jgi:hypothetical protein
VLVGEQGLGAAVQGFVPAPPEASYEQLADYIDEAFATLAARAAARVGSRDPAMALRMLEDQTLAAPPVRDDDAGEVSYWTRILELAALAGELLRTRFGGRWVQTASAALPFAFQLGGGAGGIAEVYPTNRAHKLVDDGTSESLFKLVAAAEEMVRRPPDAATGRLMPSLRTRDSVELDECVWQPLVEDTAPADVPIVVVGVDGEITFAIMRREAIEQTVDDALAAALGNLADEPVEREVIALGDQRVVVVTGSFYAAEKILDRAFMQALQAELGGRALAAATPARGELVVCADVATPARLARFVAFARGRYESFVSQQLSPRVLLVEDGRVVGCAEPAPAADPDSLRAQTEPAIPGARAAAAGETSGGKPGFWRRLFGRK